MSLIRRAGRRARRWAYHITTDLRGVAWNGLEPRGGASWRAHSPGVPLIFFEPSARAAAMWANDREFEGLLRFPWPPDASEELDWVSATPVPPQDVEIATLNEHVEDALQDMYWADPEDAYGLFDALVVDWEHLDWLPVAARREATVS